MQVRRVLIGAVAALLLMGGFASAAHASDGPPPNDNKANATVVATLPTFDQVDTSTATNETTEPDDCGTGAGHTVWYRVNVPAGTQIQVSTAGSNFDTVVAVYEEYPGDSPWIAACDDDGGPDFTSNASYTTYSGYSYYVQIGGFEGAFGDLHVRIGTIEPLGNDNFGDAYQLTDSAFVISASNAGATKEAGEPIPCNRYLTDKTVWFKWTAPAHGALDVYGDNRVVGVYTGASLAELQPVGCGDAGSMVNGGETYFIQVGVNDLAAPDGFTLRGSFIERGPAPANDDLADAETIGALGEAHNVSLESATIAPNEQLCYWGENTAWYSYTATKDAVLVASTEGSSIDTTLGVYTGSSYGDLTQVACNDNGAYDGTSRASFTVTAGQTYLFQVADYDAWYYGPSGQARITLFEGQAWGDGLGYSATNNPDGQPHETSVDALGFGGAVTSQPNGDGGHTTDACVATLVVTCRSVPLP